MTGLDKIIGEIKEESDASVKKTLDAAQAQADSIKSDSRAEAEKEAAKIREKGQTEAARIISRAESGADLVRKKALLTEKQQLISETLDAAEKKLKEMPADRYFDIMLSLIRKNAESGDGQIAFNKSDLDRLPGDFSAKVNETLKSMGRGHLTIADEPADIDGGFLLIYEGATENCSLSALFEAQAESLSDQVRKILFS